MATEGSAPAPDGAGSIDLSVVIPAYFGAATIADTLRSVLRATADFRRQIIVVESSGDAARRIVRGQFPEVVLIESPERLSAGAARNRGVEAARGPVVFFTDQDCAVPPDWIPRLERHLRQPGVGAVGGSVGIGNPSNWSGCALYFLEFLYHFPHHGPARRDRRNFIVGCNSAYRSEVLRLVRFPDQTLGEDVLFSEQIRASGYSVVYDPGVEVRHTNRKGWGEFLDYNRKMGTAAAVYQHVLKRWWAAPFLAAPMLAFLAPAVVIPMIAARLARSRPSYMLRFLLLLPACLVGNLAWATGFRREALALRRSGGTGVP